MSYRVVILSLSDFELTLETESAEEAHAKCLQNQAEMDARGHDVVVEVRKKEILKDRYGGTFVCWRVMEAQQ